MREKNNDKTPLNIIWDFDGTILPIEPYDSEQSLLFHVIGKKPFGINPLKKLFTKLLIFADNRNLLGHYFKPLYISALKGIPAHAVKEVADKLAEKIGQKEKNLLKELFDIGHRMLVISCGTRDLSLETLKAAGIVHCFKNIIANEFTYEEGKISGMKFITRTPMDKLRVAKKIGLRGENTMVIGDGPTDIPLLKWSSFPIIIDRKGKKRETEYCSVSSILETAKCIENIYRDKS